MKKIETQLQMWIDTQAKYIRKAQLAFKRLKSLLKTSDEELDASSVEIVSQNITMHFEIISQYHYTITAILKDLKRVPRKIRSQILHNQAQIGDLFEKFNALRGTANKILKSIQSKLYYTNQFVLQLSQN